MSTLISALLGCNSGQKTAKIAQTLLQEKHGETFTVVSYGDRYYKDTTTLHIYPDADPDLYFKALVSDDGELTRDEYPNRAAARQLEDQVKAIWAKEGIEVSCFTFLAYYVPEAKAGLTSYQFAETYDSDHVTVTMTIKNNEAVTAETIERVYNQFPALLPNMPWGTGLCFLNEEDFEATKTPILHDVEIFDISRLGSLGAEGDIFELVLQIQDGKLVQSTEEITTLLQGEVG
ncbi:MAG: hypothetical protein R3Y62_01500 [Eubacteriales bacterium]